MYQDIRIKHFRGFEDLSVEGLSQVNVFLGRNNSGKTSILEAVFLLAGRYNDLVPGMLGVLRGFQKDRIGQSIGYLWHNLDYTQPIQLESLSDDIRYAQEHELFPLFGEKDKLEEYVSNEGLTTTSGNKQPSRIEHRTSRYSYKEHEDGEDLEVPNIEGDYLPSNRLEANILPNLKRILESGLKEKLIEFLASFDSRITGVELIGEDVWVRLAGLQSFLPLHIVGDGLRRFVSIWSAIANPDNDVVLIDEIDNGIHHSSYRLLWEMILKTAKENNVQLFITTHSDESLMGLVEAHENLAESERAEAAIYSVAHTKSGARAYQYAVADYKDVREGHVDPRN